MGRPGPETRMLSNFRLKAQRAYGKRIVIVKYHGDEFGEAGVSDLLICLDGVFVAIEGKAPDAKRGVTVKQAAFMDRISESGGYVAVIRSVDQGMAVLASIADPEFE